MDRFIIIRGKNPAANFKKKSEASVEPFFQVYGRFLMGFWKKWGVRRGFLMVKPWWMCGELWSERWCFFRTKNMPHFGNIFLGRVL
jgi:hypothetical protein